MEFAKFNNWLNANYDPSPPERRQALKEHLYSIIDAHIKQLYERQRVTYPHASDMLLSGCFEWATRMGVYGANMVLGRMSILKAQETASQASVPAAFNLTLDGELFVLSSALDAWRVTFPYYFMLGDLREFETANGLRSEMAIVSTGFGRHTDGKGYSQATIMLVYSQKGTVPGFDGFWLEKFGLTAADQVPAPRQHRLAYEHYDAKSRMHTEVVFPKTGSGAMAVAYMGLEGTYQWNRPHFEDFLANLLVKSSQ